MPEESNQFDGLFNPTAGIATMLRVISKLGEIMVEVLTPAGSLPLSAAETQTLNQA